jgi:hypothetical protein
MEQEQQDKLNQMEADAHQGVFSERDVCALIQCYREKCAQVDGLEEQVEDLDAQVCGVPIGEICRMAQGQATPKDRATITIWLTIEDQRRAVQP